MLLLSARQWLCRAVQRASVRHPHCYSDRRSPAADVRRLVERLEDRTLPAIVSNFAAGTLTITADAADNIAISASSGNVLINGANPDSGLLAASSVDFIDVSASGDFANNIDASGVTAAAGFSSAALSLRLIAGEGNDTVTGSEFRDTIEGGLGNDLLAGGAGDDQYEFFIDGSSNDNDVIDESSGGTDFVCIFTETGGATLDLNIAGPQVVHANLTLTLGSGSTIENACANFGGNTLTGNTLDNMMNAGGTLIGGDGNDTLNGGPESDDLLIGGLGNDVYEIFDFGITLGTDRIDETGGGTDELRLLQFASGVTFDADLFGVDQVVHANLSLRLLSGSTLEVLTGGDGSDTFSLDPIASVTRTVNGGEPSTGSGDTLNFDLMNNSHTSNPGPPGEGSVTVDFGGGNSAGLSYTGIETLNLLNQSSADPSTLSIDDVTVTEGSGGTTNAVFTVTLSAAVAQTVTVNFAAGNSSADQPADFGPASGLLTFAPGTTQRTISVPIVSDTFVEPDETFFVGLSNAIGASLADGHGVGTILNDDFDDDQDGVDSAIEDQAPNGGDGNADGTLDREQAHVTSLLGTESQFVTLVVPTGKTLQNVQFLEDTPAGAPAVRFPFGVFQFQVSGLPAGGATTVEYLLPSGVTINTFYKFGTEPQNPNTADDETEAHWYEFLYDGTTGAEFFSDRIVLHFVDGLRGDDDLTANGVIVDDGAPGQQATGFSNVSFVTGNSLTNVSRNLSGTTATYTPTADNGMIGVDQVVSDLHQGFTVVVETTRSGGAQEGDIIVGAAIAKSSGGAATIELRASDDVLFNTGAGLTSSADTLTIVINADRDANNDGEITISGPTAINSFGGAITLGGGADPATAMALKLNIAAGATVSSESSSATAGVIKLNAKEIVIAGSILANMAGQTAGDITARATVTSTEGSANQTVSITIEGGTVKGGKLDFEAASTITATQTQQAASIDVTSKATLDVKGASQIVSANDAIFRAKSTVSATTTGNVSSGTVSFGNVDAAAVQSLINSTTTALFAGSTVLTIGGTLTVEANNTRTVSATADGTGGGSTAYGGTAARTNITGDTKAGFSGSVAVSQAADIDLFATTTDTLTTTAKATAGGANANSANTQQNLNRANASTSNGSITVAAAFALTERSGSTQAFVESDQLIKATNAIDIEAKTKVQATTTADASATNSTGNNNSPGVGVAVAIALPTITNEAHLDRATRLEAQNINVVAQMPSGQSNTITTDATSGAGASGSSLGVAGSLAITRSVAKYEALVKPSASVNAGPNGTPSNLKLSAANASSITTNAKPTGTAGGVAGTLGIGASVAIASVENTSRAEVTDTAALTNVKDLTIEATGTHALTTTAQVGAAGSTTTNNTSNTSGSSNIDAAVALAIGRNQTTARLGTHTGATSITGNLAMTATQTGTATTNGTAEGAASSIAAGAVFGYADLINRADASLARGITATGNISVTSQNATTSNNTTKATAKGTASTSNANAQAQQQKNLANANKPNGSNTQNVPNAATSGGNINAAAAIGVNLVDSQAVAKINTHLVVQSEGTIVVSAANNTDVTTDANASTVDAAANQSGQTGGTGTSNTNAGLGIGVAINSITATHEAIVTGGGTVDGKQGVTLEAKMRDVSSNSTNDFTAKATSGAGDGQNLGVAGAAAINLSDVTRGKAAISGQSSVRSAGPINITSANTTNSTTTATAKQPDQVNPKFGLGASFALTAVDVAALSLVEDGTTLTGRDSGNKAGAITISAAGTHTSTTKSESGADGGTALDFAIAIALNDNTTTASLGTSSEKVNTSGSLSLTATHTGQTTVTADGTVTTNAGAGASVALAFPTNTALATIARDIDADQDVSIRADNTSASTVTAKGSAKGINKSNETANSTNDQTNRQTNGVNTNNGQTAPSSPSATTPNTDTGSTSNSSGTSTVSSALTASGSGSSTGTTTTTSSQQKETKIGVAAAIGVSVAATTTQATVTAGRNITSRGALKLHSGQNVDATTKGDASQTGENVGVAVGVAIAGGSTVNAAVIGATTTINTVGVSLEAVNIGDGVNKTETTAISGESNATDVGVAGAFAMNLMLNNNTVAAIDGLATIAASTGDVTIKAEHSTDSIVSAKATESAGTTGITGGTGTTSNTPKTGVGASVAVNIVVNQTTAEVGQESPITSAKDLSVTATGKHKLTTTAEGGAEAKSTTSSGSTGGSGSGSGSSGSTTSGGCAVAASIAVAYQESLTTASLASSTTASSIGGKLTVEAKNNSTDPLKTTAKGLVQGDRTAVGISAALTIADDQTKATVNREITTGATLGQFGDVLISATGVQRTVTEATAALKGADTDKSGDATTVLKNLSSYTALKGVAGGKDPPNAQAKEGSVGVSAALAGNVALAKVTAEIGSQGNIKPGLNGSVTVKALSNTDAKAVADASQVSRTQVSEKGIAVAAAVNYANPDTVARIASGARVDATALTVQAGLNRIGSVDQPATLEDVNEFEAKATSGAGGKKVGAAGSFALNVLDTIQSDAVIESTAIVNLRNGNLLVDAGNHSKNTATADAVLATGVNQNPDVGVGASVALNIVDDRTRALVEDNAEITGTAGTITVTASGVHDVKTEAKAGGAGILDTAGSTSVDPAVAVSVLPVNLTSARIGTSGSPLNSLTAIGFVNIAAIHKTNVSTSADGKASGDSASVGVAIAFAYAPVTVTATLDRNLTAGGHVTVQATTAQHDIKTEAFAAANGVIADLQKNVGTQLTDGVGWVNKNVSGLTGNATGGAGSSSSGSQQIIDPKIADVVTRGQKETSDQSKNSSADVGVAAALAVNVLTKATTQASIGKNVTVTATGDVLVQSEHDTDVTAIATGLTAELNSNQNIPRTA